MEALIQLLQQSFEDPGMLRLVLVGLIGATFILFGLGIGLLVLGAVDPIRRRIGKDQRKSEVHRGRMLVWVDSAVGPVANYVLPRNEIERTKITEKLVHAGFRAPNALQILYALKIVLAVLFPSVFLFAAQWWPDLTTQTVLIVAVITSAMGLLIPSMVLDRLLEKRLKKLRNAFPDALDMLVVCVEAGLGLGQAIQRVADELSVSHPELAQELSLVNAEIRAGVDRVVALKNLAHRTGLDDVRGLVSLLVQTLRFGTSIAESLRVYSDEFRDKRMQRAEELAAKIGTKLIFPLIVFLFPGFFVVAVGPAVVGLIGVFAQM